MPLVEDIIVAADYTSSRNTSSQEVDLKVTVYTEYGAVSI